MPSSQSIPEVNEIVLNVADYSVFGLRVRSELALPELFPVNGEGDADVTIRLGSIGDPQQEEGLHAVEGALLFVISKVGRYRIADGGEILVEPAPGAPERNVRLYLLGSAFGALLHQRGLLPLHANAVEIDGRAVAFMAESGGGKSTLAAWFHDRGYRVIADDVCVIHFDEGRPHAAPGLPRLRLWLEALEFTGRDRSGYHRSYVAESESFDKFDVPINSAAAVQSHVPLSAVYLLDRGGGFSITELTGVAAIEAVFANTYRGSYVSAANGEESHWLSAVRLVQETPVYCVSREWGLASQDEQYCRLLEHASGDVRSDSDGSA